MIATKTRSRRPWRGGKEGYGGQFYTRLTGGAVGEVGDRDSRAPRGGAGRWCLVVTSAAGHQAARLHERMRRRRHAVPTLPAALSPLYK